MLNLSRPTVYKMIEDGHLKRYLALGRPALKLADVTRMKSKLEKNGTKKAGK